MARELVHQMGSAAADLPRFLTAPQYRSWHLRWGATDAEVAAPMPGDDLLPGAQFRPTRAITVDAPPAAVWPWLVRACRVLQQRPSRQLRASQPPRDPPHAAAARTRPVGLDVTHTVGAHRLEGRQLCAERKAAVAQTRQHVVMGAARPRGREDPAGHSCPCALRLVPPGIGRIRAGPHGIRRLRHDAANALGASSSMRKHVRSPVHTPGQCRVTIT